jgi:hypothetical protein
MGKLRLFGSNNQRINLINHDKQQVLGSVEARGCTNIKAKKAENTTLQKIARVWFGWVVGGAIFLLTVTPKAYYLHFLLVYLTIFTIICVIAVWQTPNERWAWWLDLAEA